MGTYLHISIIDDDRISLSISNRLKYDIFDNVSDIHSEFSYLNFGSFLKQDEIEILEPNWDDGVVTGVKKLTIGSYLRMFKKMFKAVKGPSIEDPFDEILETSSKLEDRQRDPLKFKLALNKVEQYMIDHAHELPLSHDVYISPTCDVESHVEQYRIGQTEMHFNGDTCSYSNDFHSNRMKLQVVFQPDTGDRYEKLINVGEEVELLGHKFFIRTMPMAEVFADEIEAINRYLDKAISEEKMILFEYS